MKKYTARIKAMRITASNIRVVNDPERGVVSGRS
jgi:hypothetical protein